MLAEDPEFADLIRRASEKADAILAHDDIRPDDFRDVFSREEIERDKAKVRGYEQKFAADDAAHPEKERTMGRIIEALIYDQVKNNGWFGSDTSILHASKYDDFVNGVDCITTHRDKGATAYLALGIDATITSHPGNKFQRIREDLLGGALGKIKYFKTEEDHKPLKRDVPHVVVGASPQTLKEVLSLRADGDAERLKSHPVQLLFLAEIVVQLEGFKKFLQMKKQQKTKTSWTAIFASSSQPCSKSTKR